MSNAQILTSPRANMSFLCVSVTSPCFTLTLYHHPHLVSVSMRKRMWYGTSYSRMSIMASA